MANDRIHTDLCKFLGEFIVSIDNENGAGYVLHSLVMMGVDDPKQSDEYAAKDMRVYNRHVHNIIKANYCYDEIMAMREIFENSNDIASPEYKERLLQNFLLPFPNPEWV
jgi:hypothetical protein